MEYSLYQLNKYAKLNDINLSDIVDRLNLIGFEVDDIFYERCTTDKFINNIRLLIEIPSNREDLLNEQLFLKELGTIFLFEIYQTWKDIQQTYSFLNIETSSLYQTQKVNLIKSDLSNILIYKFELENCFLSNTPIWIKQKLLNGGLVPEDNLNDLLNLIVLEYGSNITSSYFQNFTKDFIIERLQKSENFISVEKKLELIPCGSIVLRNSSDEIVLVLGYLNFLPLDNSNSLVSIEGIFYDINENILKLNTLNTFLSFRHLRKTFTEYFIASFKRLLTLLNLYSSGLIIKNIYTNVLNDLNSTKNLILKVDKLLFKNVLGISSFDYSIFKKASLIVLGETSKSFYFNVSPFRTDLVRPIDLIEEYSRFIGYKNFDQVIPEKQLVYTNKKLKNYSFIRQFFINYGFNEIFSNTLAEKNDNSFTINLENPLNSEVATLRNSLFNRLFDIYQLNSKSGFINNNFFEIGRVFKQSNNTIIEQDKLAGIFESNLFIKTNLINSNDWFIVKGFFEAFLEQFGYTDIQSRLLSKKTSYFHPTKSIQFTIKNKVLGTFGEINPIIQDFRNLKKPIYIFEFNLNHFKNWRMNKLAVPYVEYSKYPSVTRDLSFSVLKKQNLSDLKSQILSQARNLKKVNFFDIYFDEQIHETINLGIRLEFQSNLKTLNNVEVEEELKSIKETLVSSFLADFNE